MSTPRKPRKSITAENMSTRNTEKIITLPPQLASRERKPRVTPRNSTAGDTTPIDNETPYSTLRQLANVIPRPTTPLQRASSVAPLANLSGRRTPAAQDRTPGGLQRPGSTRRQIALTPHARAAIRENELRRAAALTPGRDRRRSGRQQRETPRDILRQLSKVLAPGTEPIEPSPTIDSKVDGKLVLRGEDDDLEDGPQPQQPRLSMPLDEDEDDSYLLPPRFTDFIEEDNATQRSVELPRRATSEQPGGRLSRGSFGSMRTSDRWGDQVEDALNAPVPDDFNPSFAQGSFDDDEEMNLGDESSILRGAQVSPRYLSDNIQRLSAAAERTSDVRLLTVPEEETERTFLIALPQRDSLGSRSSAAVPGSETGDEDPENSLDIDIEDSMVSIVEKETVDQSHFGESASIHAGSAREQLHSTTGPRKAAKIKKALRISRHGIHYSSLPTGVVKSLAMTFLRQSGNSKAKISKETLQAIMQATDWFFEQASDDLGAYAKHAGRKTIDESDVVTLMRRQRQTNTNTTPFALAQRYLPRELLQDLRMVAPTKLKKGPRLGRVEEDDELEKE